MEVFTKLQMGEPTNLIVGVYYGRVRAKEHICKEIVRNPAGLVTENGHLGVPLVWDNPRICAQNVDGYLLPSLKKGVATDQL